MINGRYTDEKINELIELAKQLEHEKENLESCVNSVGMAKRSLE